MRLMNDSANFADRCTPSSDCWPSQDEWDELDILLGGKLLRDVEPYLGPCHDPLRVDQCGARVENFADNYFRDGIPGAMM